MGTFMERETYNMKLPLRIFLIAQLGFIYADLSAQKTILPKNQIKASPVRLVDFVNPCIEFGYERLHGDWFSTLVSGGLVNDVFHSSWYDKVTGGRVTLEEKYFFIPSERVYLSLEFVYNRIKFTDVAQFGYNENIGWLTYKKHVYLDTFSAKKTTVSVNFRCGWQLVLARRLLLEVTGGVGLKYKTMEHFDRINNGHYLTNWGEIYSISNDERARMGFNLPLNVRLGFCF
jgi:hypothetical protein